MPTRTEKWPAGTPCWADLSVPDLDAAKQFYAAVLGWDVVDMGERFGHYHLAHLPNGDAAGIGPLMAEGQPSAWTLYFASDDVDATAARITANGGTLMFDPMPVPEDASMGRMMMAVDPTGAVFGVWQATGYIGSSIYNEPGGLTWDDLRSPDPSAARSFYDAVFGFTHEPVDGVQDGTDYMTFHSGGDPLGGMGDLMGIDQPPHWAVYFGVADADAALSAVTAAGGAVIAPAFETPYGRMACVADPAGAMFWIVDTPS
jgi:predicted enzyme related to lactoylglutathione lyase